jgi:two-component system OmpR family sensor kinase
MPPTSCAHPSPECRLRSSIDRSERERLAFHVVREAGRASRLIDDMLMMARVDQGLVLDRRRIDLADVVAREVERQRIRKPALAIDCGPDPRHTGDGLVVEADSERVTQVIANLIDNASRMTGGTGPVAVTWKTAEGHALVTVSDHGPGVPQGDRARIFDRLVRLETARNAGGGGAGLGLPIARGIARASGGDLACVEPSPRAEGGAAFLLTLPLAADQPSTPV